MSAENNQSINTQVLVPYLLYAYQKGLRTRPRTISKVKIHEDIKYNLTKELVRANINYLKQAQKNIGLIHGSELCAMWQHMNLTKQKLRNSRVKEEKKSSERK